jgi:hypothetical protein
MAIREKMTILEVSSIWQHFVNHRPHRMLSFSRDLVMKLTSFITDFLIAPFLQLRFMAELLSSLAIMVAGAEDPFKEVNHGRIFSKCFTECSS